MPRYKTLTLAGAGMVGLAALLYAEEVKTDQAEAKVEDFEAKIAYDHAPIENSGQLVMSYADVVQKVLPSVASISTFKKPGEQPRFGGGQRQLNEEELEALPPMFREFFRDYMERNPQGQEEENPRAQRQRQRQQQTPVRTGLGSGFVLTEDGYIITNNHVVADSDELKVTIGNSPKEYTAKVIGKDPQTDVALIKIDAKGLVPAKIGDSTKVRVGDVVLAMGSPMGLDQSVTQGIVSAMGRNSLHILGDSKAAGYEDFIQTDAAINPGNSGGPLVDAKGRVIGVNTAIQTRTGMFAGIGLSIPSNMAVSIAVDLLGDGKVERGFLGIQMGDVDPGMAEFLGLEDNRGVTVTAVVEDSPAEKAGFQSGDVIVTVDGAHVDNFVKLRLIIGSKRAGQEVKFGVKRFNEASKQPEDLQLNAVLHAQDNDKMLANMRQGPGNKNPGSPEAGKANELLKGVRVSALTAELRGEYSVAEDVEGLLVTSVDEDSPAGKKGLQEGDVIVKVDRKAVKTLAEARALRGDSGSTMLLEILREGQTKFLPVKN